MPNPKHGRLRVEYVPLKSIKTAKRNPKRHNEEAIDASINRFGYTQPMLRNERTGLLVAGHGRLKTLRKQHAAGSAPPARVEVANDGDWLVPVLCGVEFNSDAEAEAYLLADNRLVELGGYDNAELLEALQSVSEKTGSLAGVGWSNDDLASMLNVSNPDLGSDSTSNGSEETQPTGAPPLSGDEGKKYESKYAVLINCATEEQQKELFERFSKEGLTVKVLAI